MAVDVDVDWLNYFESIKSVCPWSSAAHRHNKIDIQQGIDPKPLDQYLARIYILNNITTRRLKKLAGTLERTRPDEIWFFSYPGYGPFATPVSCLIQQSRNHLENIRNNLN
jgi:hypothetical protein